MIKHSIACVGLLVTVFATLACREATVAPMVKPLVVKLSVSKTQIVSGDSTVLSLTISNTSGKRLAYEVMAGELAFDYSIVNASGAEVWRRSKQQVMAGASATLVLQPGQTTVLATVLRLRDVNGIGLAAGRYQVAGFFLDERSELIAPADAAVEIQVLTKAGSTVG